MNIFERIIVILLTLFDRVLDFFTFGLWTRVRGSVNSNAIVKGK
jgi:hypothetical protein